MAEATPSGSAPVRIPASNAMNGGEKPALFAAFFEAFWVDPVFSDAQAKDTFGQTQFPGGFADVSTDLFDCVHDHLLFERFQCRIERSPWRFRSIFHLEGGRKVVGLNCALITQENCPFDAVFELADVSGPMIGHEHVDCCRGDAMDRFVAVLCILLDEKVGELQDVAFSLAKGGECKSGRH